MAVNGNEIKSEMSLKEKLMHVQSELKAPKGQYNSYGGYKYRSCEDILEAVKPLLKKYRVVIGLVDVVAQIGDRIYVRAVATLSDVDSTAQIKTSAFAREALTKKGIDESQITGSASSYARKYALNGLFAIDDTKDADADEQRAKQQSQQSEETLTKSEVADVRKYIKNKRGSEEQFCAANGIKKLEALSRQKYNWVVKQMMQQ